MKPINELGWGYYDSSVKLFYKRVDKKKHFMLKHNGYGIDFNLLVKLVKANYKILIAESTTVKHINLYYITAQDFKDKGIMAEYGDYKAQVFINIKDLKKIN